MHWYRVIFLLPVSEKSIGEKHFLVSPYPKQAIPKFDCIFALLRRRQWQPTPVLLPGKSHGRRSLVGFSPWGRGESDMTERLHFYFSLSCTGEGNGNPPQCSCLENPRDGRAWWAAIYGVAQSQTGLKWLSSSSCFVIANDASLQNHSLF